MPYIILAVAACAAIAVFLYPKEWKKSLAGKIIIGAIHAVGLSSEVIMTFFLGSLDTGFFRDAVVFTASAYFVILTFSDGALILLKIICFASRKSRISKAISNPVIPAILIFCAAGLFAAGYIHAETIRTVNYEIFVEKPCSEKSIRLAVISDLHTGAGTRSNNLAAAAEIINGSHADAVLIAGDIADETTSRYDIDCLSAFLKEIDVTTYGTYFVWGNHDITKEAEVKACLENAGVTILDNEAVRLGEANLIGVSDDVFERISPDEIIEEYAVDISEPVILLQHRPEKLDECADAGCDAAFCGHTHGMRYPVVSMFQLLKYDMVYGKKSFGDMTAVTSSGMSAWGFNFKLPAESEVIIADIYFE